MEYKSLEKQVLKTGTTTVGIVCKDGIVLAADKRATAGNLIAMKDVEKVIVIDENFVITTAGLVSDIQLLTKLLKAQLKLEELRRGKKVTVKGAVNLLAGMVYSNIRKFSTIPGIVGFLFGGRDHTGFYLYEVGVDGSLHEFKDYASDGSGSVFAFGLFEAEYKKNLSIEDGIKLAIKAINSAMQRDSATGSGIDVVTITNKGARKVLTREVNNKIIA